MGQHEVSLNVNGEPVSGVVAAGRSLLDFLREDVQVTGTKKGCETGHCGACSVLLDGRLVVSCLVMAVEADGCAVTTVEGLAPVGGGLHPVQEAFQTQGGFQCGYCTPGMVMASHALLMENPSPSEAEIRSSLRGNLCRCTGYQNIIRAVQAAASILETEQGIADDVQR